MEQSFLESQSGFLPNRGVPDHIFTLRQICEKVLQLVKNINACFINLQMTFDQIRREDAWRSRKRKNIDGTTVDCIKSLYERRNAEVRA